MMGEVRVLRCPFSRANAPCKVDWVLSRCKGHQWTSPRFLNGDRLLPDVFVPGFGIGLDEIVHEFHAARVIKDRELYAPAFE